MVDEGQTVDWLTSGHPENVASSLAESEVNIRLAQINAALDLIAYVLRVSPDRIEQMAVNDFSAIACFTRAFGAIRSAVAMVLFGYYAEARSTMRACYEAAGLGRMLAKDVPMAEKWLSKKEWVPDSKVRASIEAQVLPDGMNSPYREFYRRATAAAHPSAESSVRLALKDTGNIHLQLVPEFDAQLSVMTLSEIAYESIFVCLALRRAIAKEAAFPPAWDQALSRLAGDVTGQTMEDRHERPGRGPACRAQRRGPRLGRQHPGFHVLPGKDLDLKGEAVRLADAARQGYPGASPRLSAVVNLRAAQAYAMADEPTRCREYHQLPRPPREVAEGATPHGHVAASDGQAFRERRRHPPRIPGGHRRSSGRA